MKKQSTAPVLWLPIKILMLTRLGPTVLYYRIYFLLVLFQLMALSINSNAGRFVDLVKFCGMIMKNQLNPPLYASLSRNDA